MTKKEDLLKRVSELRKEEHKLLLQEDRREIKRDKFETLVEPIQKEIRETNNQILEIMYAENREKDEKPNEALVKVTKQLKKIKEAQGIKQGRKRESTSWLSLVMKALEKDDVRNVNDAVKQVNKWRPGREQGKTEHQVKVTIYRVKKQYPGPYTDYTWNETKYKLERQTK